MCYNEIIKFRKGKWIMLKKTVTLLLTLSLLLGASMAFAAEKAKAGAEPAAKTERVLYPRAYEKEILAAKSEVPATAEYQGMLTEQETDKTAAFSFFDNSTLRAYEVTVIKGINKVKTVKIGGSNIPGSTTVNKTVDDIEEIIRLEYPDGKIISIEQKFEGNLSYYEAQLETQRFTADLKLNPVTGAIGSRVLEYKMEIPKTEEKKQPSGNPAKETPAKPEKQNPAPSVPSEWMCGNCGNLNHEGQFCSNCGIQRPADMEAEASVVKCSKCGWKPRDPNNPPNFCPECGNQFEK